MESKQTTDQAKPTDEMLPHLDSTAIRSAPKLSHQSLTMMLAAMCVVPAVTIFAMFQFLPAVFEDTLEAEVTPVDLPVDSYYEQHYSDRPVYTDGSILVRNTSDQEWTHMNIQVNKHYQIYDEPPIAPGEEREFKLNRFVSRTGARFSLRYNPLRQVRIYARRPSKDRATFQQTFDLPPALTK